MKSFGRSMLTLWHLDPAFSYLNHGTVGATPIPVLDEQQKLIAEIERRPAQYILREVSNPNGLSSVMNPPRLRSAAERLGAYVGADEPGLVFTANVTTAINAVLALVAADSKQKIAVTNVGYGGVTNAAAVAAQRAGVSLSLIELPAPGSPIELFVDALESQLEADVDLILLDHITAFSSLVLPVAEMAAVCRAKGAKVLVDGAHVPGQIPLDIGALGVDYYAANLHKWLWVPRSAGMLWVAPQHRGDVHSPVVSWGRDRGLAAEFDSPGTLDPSPFLVTPAVLDFRSTFGEGAIVEYIHRLAVDSLAYLLQTWESGPSAPESMIGAMFTVRLPERLGSTGDHAENLRAFLYDRQIEVPVFPTTPSPYGSPTEPGMVVRICTQVYNDHSDIERLVQAVAEAPRAQL